VAGVRVLYGEWNRGERPQMQDVIDSLAGVSHRVGITQIHFTEVDPVTKSIQIRRLSGQVVIQPPDFITAIYQSPR
jgi:hypothetical protein